MIGAERIDMYGYLNEWLFYRKINSEPIKIQIPYYLNIAISTSILQKL